MKIAKLKSLKSQSEPITVQSVIRLVELENRQNFIEMIQSIEGESFLKRWLTQLKGNVIIVQKWNPTLNIKIVMFLGIWEKFKKVDRHIDK